MNSTKAVRTALETLGVRTLSAGMEYISNTPALLPQDQLDTSATLIEALTDHPDVVRVWDNIQALEWGGKDQDTECFIRGISMCVCELGQK